MTLLPAHLSRHLGLRVGAALGLIVLSALGMVAGIHLALRTMDADAILLNESGRLRMVSQKIAKSAALTISGNEGAREELRAAIDLFDRTYASVLAHLPPVAEEQYGIVDAVWSDVRAAALVVADPAADPDEAQAAKRAIERLNLSLLKEANAGVSVIQQNADSHVARIGQILLVGLVLIVLSGLAASVILRKSITQIIGLDRVTRDLAEGSERTVEVRSSDEVGSLAAAIQALSVKVQRRNGVIETIMETVARVDAEAEPSRALEVIVDAARRVTQSSHGVVVLFEDGSVSSLAASGSGLPGWTEGQTPRTHPLFARAESAEGQLFVCDTHDVLDLARLPGLPAVQRVLAAPLVAGSDVIGVAYVAHADDSESFSDDDRQFFGQLTRLAANAVETKRVSARRRTERLRMRSVSEELRTILTRVGQGDLTVEPSPLDQRDAIGEVREGVRGMIVSLRTTLSEVVGASQQLAAASTQIASSTDQLAHVSGLQAEGARVVERSLGELVDTINANAQTANESARASEASGRAAQEGGDVVGQTVTQIRQIADVVNESARRVHSLEVASSQIGEIVDAISDIANQTNLLALNAAIEAARAGSAGRGFAVVADEVRKLAERTTQATQQAEAVIGSIQAETTLAVEAMEKGAVSVSDGMALADQTADALSRIVESAERTSNLVAQIATATEEQSATAQTIAHSVTEMDAYAARGLRETEHTAAGVQQTSALAESLSELVSRFRLEVGYERPAMPSSRAAPSMPVTVS